MNDWPIASLGDLTTKIGSGATPRGGKSVYRREGTAFIRSQNVLDNSLKLDDIARISDEAADALKGVTVEPGDVLINITGDSIARCARVEPEILPARVNQHVSILRPNGHLHAGYLQRVLVNPIFKARLLTMSEGGGTRKALTKADLAALMIPLPPFGVQLGIAEVLGALDEKTAANDRVADGALKTGDALMARELASDGGRRVTFGDLVEHRILELSDGYRTKRDEHGETGLRILRAGDVRGNRVAPTGADFVSSAFMRQIGRKASQPGDIILTTKGTVGRMSVVPTDMEEVVYSPQICFFRVLDSAKLDPGFLAGWFRSPDLKRQTATVMFKSDMAPYISLTDIRSLSVPLPSVARQKEIGASQRVLLDLFASKVTEGRLLADLRDALLPQLMSGKLKVKDAERVIEGVV